MARYLVFLFVLPIAAQVHIDAGSTADKNYSGGFAYTYPGLPAGAALPTMRYGNFSYSFSLAPGDYTVALTFIERVVSTPGAHVFNVSVNGAVVLPNLDLFALAGSNVPVVRTFPVKVVASPLVLSFSTVTRNAIVNTIDVLPVPVTPSPVYLKGPLSERPAICPGPSLTFFVDTSAYELYWCLAPGGWVKATSKDVILGRAGCRVIWRIEPAAPPTFDDAICNCGSVHDTPACLALLASRPGATCKTSPDARVFGTMPAGGDCLLR